MDWAEVGKLGGLSLGLLVFVILIALDARRAIKRKTHWVPGRALVLSALTIQLLTLFTAQISTLRNDDTDRQPQQPENPYFPQPQRSKHLRLELLMVHIGRVMICVFVGYLLPVMARAGSKNYRTRLIALLCTISFQIASEIYAVNRRQAQQASVFGQADTYQGERSMGLAITVSTATVLGSILLLLMLLTTATFASKSIHDTVSQKIPVILAIHDPHPTWQTVEDQIIKSWIAVKVCQPEYIIARSVLVATAGCVVTACLLISVVGWGIQGSGTERTTTLGPEESLKYVVIGLQCLFIAIGWGIITWRWVTAVMFFGRRMSVGWREYFRNEDYWTRRIVDQMDADESELSKGRKKVLKIRAARKKIWFPAQLLPVLIFLQDLVVLVSKICWALSELCFCNRYCFGKFMLSKWQGLSSDPDYSRFEPALEAMRMPDEQPDSIWVANRESVRQAKILVIEGFDDGKRCGHLTNFISSRCSLNRSGLVCLEFLKNSLSNDNSLKYLCRVRPSLLRVESCFVFAQRSSWKMTIVALLNMVVALSPTHGSKGKRSVGLAEEAMEAYAQAWEIVDIVDDMDPESYYSSRAADKLFMNLQADVDAGRWVSYKKSDVGTVLRDLAHTAKARSEPKDLGNDSLDWREVAASNAIYKMFMSVDIGAAGGHRAELLEEAVMCIADVIDGALELAAKALVANSQRWTREMKEKYIWKCLYVAGKVRAVMEDFGRQPEHLEELHKYVGGDSGGSLREDDPAIWIE